MVLGNNYKKFYHVYSFPSPGPGTHLGYIREDSVTRKVYFLDKTASSEDLLYDFSLNVGDTAYFAFPSPSGNFPMGYYKVKSIINVMTKVGLRKQWNLKRSTGSSDTLKYIESIGSIIHPVYMYSSYYGMGQFSWTSPCTYPYDLGLACKYSDNVKFYQSCTYSVALSSGCFSKPDSCDYWNVCSGIKENSMIRDIFVFPNPATNEVVVNLALNQEAQPTLEILDITGRKVKIIPYEKLPPGENEIRIDLTDIASGSYFLNIRIKEQELKTPLIIVH